LRIREVALLVIASMAFAACGSSGKNEPAPEPSSPFGFTVVGQFNAEATVGSQNKQSISVTVSKPLTVAQQTAAGRPMVCSPLSEKDVFVPLVVKITNSSTAAAPTMMIGATLTEALNDSALDEPFAISVQNDEGGECSPQGPLKNLTTNPIILDAGTTAINLWSPANLPTKPGQYITAKMHLLVSGGSTLPPPPLSAVFLRITPFKTQLGKVPYKITKLTAAKMTDDGTTSNAGTTLVVTGGTDKGAFYVPLDGATNPCDTIAKGLTNVKCGAELTAPH